VHSKQQIAVERRCDTKRIVVGDEQPLRRLDEIDPQQHRIAVLDGGADVLQKCGSPRRIEVPDVRPEKRDERPTRSLRERLAQTGIVGRLVRDDARVTDASYGLRSDRQGTWRHVDEMYVHWLLPPRRRLEERPQLFAVARAQFDNVGQRWQAAEDAVAMRREQTHLCP